MNERYNPSVRALDASQKGCSMKRTRQKRPAVFRLACFVVFLLAAFSFVACTNSASADSGQSASGNKVSASSSGGFKAPSSLTMPDTSGASECIDATHANDGYVCAAKTSNSRLKLQVSNGDATYNYDMPNDGTPAVAPINMGDGHYRFRIMQNTEGSNYVELECVEQDVKLTSEFAPFLIPNLYCNYNEKSQCTAKARELAQSCASEADAFKEVCTFITKNITYDKDKAKKLAGGSGYIPNPDDTLKAKSGICFDYASLGAAMLRSLGIPTKVVTGYVAPGDLYHAWIMVYADGEWKTGEFAVSKDAWSRVDLTFAASGSSEFTGDGTSYTDRYVY